MGHYRSEMGYDLQDQKEKERKEAQFLRIQERIEEDLSERGISYVLAKMLVDPYHYRLG